MNADKEISLEDIKEYDPSWWLEVLKKDGVFDTGLIGAQWKWMIREIERLQREEK